MEVCATTNWRSVEEELICRLDESILETEEEDLLRRLDEKILKLEEDDLFRRWEEKFTQLEKEEAQQERQQDTTGIDSHPAPTTQPLQAATPTQHPPVAAARPTEESEIASTNESFAHASDSRSHGSHQSPPHAEHAAVSKTPAVVAPETPAPATAATPSKNTVPGPMDIILFRGRPPSTAHEGNERFQKIVHSYIGAYDQCQSKKEKRTLTRSILFQVQKDGARMFRKDKEAPSGWYQLNDEEARQRVVHTLRSLGAGSKKQPLSTSEAAAAPKSAPTATAATLPKKTVPGPIDIILFRGRPSSTAHEGNERFQKIVHNYIGAYDRCQGQEEKRALTWSILSQVQKDGARMFRKDEEAQSGWYQLNNEEARQRVGHTLRSFGAGPKKQSHSTTGQIPDTITVGYATSETAVAPEPSSPVTAAAPYAPPTTGNEQQNYRFDHDITEPLQAAATPTQNSSGIPRPTEEAEDDPRRPTNQSVAHASASSSHGNRKSAPLTAWTSASKPSAAVASEPPAPAPTTAAPRASTTAFNERQNYHYDLNRVLPEFENQAVFDEAIFETEFLEPFKLDMQADYKEEVDRLVVSIETHPTSLTLMLVGDSRRLLDQFVEKASKWRRYRRKLALFDILLKDPKSHVLDLEVSAKKSMGLVLGLSLVRLGVLSKEIPLSPKEGVWFDMHDRKAQVGRVLDKYMCKTGAAILAVANRACSTRNSVIDLIQKEKATGNPTFFVTLCLSGRVDIDKLNPSKFRVRTLADFRREKSTTTLTPVTAQRNQATTATTTSSVSTPTTGKRKDPPRSSQEQPPKTVASTRHSNPPPARSLPPANTSYKQSTGAPGNAGKEDPPRQAASTGQGPSKPAPKDHDTEKGLTIIDTKALVDERKASLKRLLQDLQSVELSFQLSTQESLGAKLWSNKDLEVGGSYLHEINPNGQLGRALGKQASQGIVCLHKANWATIHEATDFKKVIKVARAKNEAHFIVTLVLEDGVDISRIDASKLIRDPRRLSGKLYPLQPEK